VSDLLVEFVDCRREIKHQQELLPHGAPEPCLAVAARVSGHQRYAMPDQERTRAWHFFEHVEGTSTEIISTTPFTSIMLQLSILPMPASLIHPLAPAMRPMSPSRASIRGEHVHAAVARVTQHDLVRGARPQRWWQAVGGRAPRSRRGSRRSRRLSSGATMSGCSSVRL
jgi:hypothetical protein